MFWTIAVIVLCAAAVGFYLHFLIALCKDCKLTSTGYWMLVRVHPNPNSDLTLAESHEPIRRAA